jgi:hypothetical protein
MCLTGLFHPPAPLTDPARVDGVWFVVTEKSLYPSDAYGCFGKDIQILAAVLTQRDSQSVVLWDVMSGLKVWNQSVESCLDSGCGMRR